jgi:phosphoglycolate phosphatase
MTPQPYLAWLFDIDGTLLLTEGAAREAFARAVGEAFHVEDGLDSIEFAGRTEPLILADILRKHGRTFSRDEEAQFWNTVVGHMQLAFPPGRGRLLPGIVELLDAIASEPRWVVGLLTGNMSEMARIKLTRFGLLDRFAFGAFGEEAPNRDALACNAVASIQARYGIPAHRCIVVGDTEHDIACARAAGARVVAVATGSKSRPELEALRPDLALDDLSETQELLDWARRTQV